LADKETAQDYHSRRKVKSAMRGADTLLKVQSLRWGSSAGDDSGILEQRCRCGIEQEITIDMVYLEWDKLAVIRCTEGRPQIDFQTSGNYYKSGQLLAFGRNE
jgi:hypothetical protein